MRNREIAVIVILGAIMTVLIIAAHYEINKEVAKVDRLKAQVTKSEKENQRLTDKISKVKKEIGKVKVTYIGTFKATFYTDNEACCGNSNGITSTGTQVSDKTVAVDPDVIPMGSLIYIEGIGFRYAEDTGGAIDGKILDIYVDSYAEAVELGVKYTKVYLIEEE